MLCLIDCDDTCDYLLDCLVGEIGECEGRPQRLPQACEEGIGNVVRGNILGELAIKILKPDRELGDCFLWFLAYGVELSEQFSLRDFAMEELEETAKLYLLTRPYATRPLTEAQAARLRKS